MGIGLKGLLGVAVALTAVSVGVISISAILWQRRSHARVAALIASARHPPAPAPEGLALPAPVARYLERSAPASAGEIRWARFEQSGTFRTSGDPERWGPFTAVEVFSSDPPGFLWDARIRMAPLVSVLVRDQYAGGQGSMVGRVAGLFRVVDAFPDPALTRGALMRFLAESVWIPTRLRPSATLAWTPQTDTSAIATLTDGSVQVSLELRFNGQGDVVEVFAPLRPREEAGSYIDQPWIVRLDQHEWVDGFRIPRWGEVSWITRNGPEPYWRGRIDRAHIEAVPQKAQRVPL